MTTATKTPTTTRPARCYGIVRRHVFLVTEDDQGEYDMGILSVRRYENGFEEPTDATRRLLRTEEDKNGLKNHFAGMLISWCAANGKWRQEWY